MKTFDLDHGSRGGLRKALAMWACLPAFLAFNMDAAPVLTAWQPLFKGIDLARGTNTVSSGDFNNRMVMHVLRIDLADPDVRLLPSPRITSYVAGLRETAGMTVSRFVESQGVQVAVNSNFFDPTSYYLPEGTPMLVSGLQVSGGQLVSSGNLDHSASILFDASNRPTVVHTNWPVASTVGVESAVSGDYPIVVRGVNIGRLYLNQSGFIHDTNPRSAMGVSADQRHLYLMVIDGRQAQSAGALDYETGAWMLLVGAHDAINMDGGGSATMAMQSATGAALRLNASSAVADSGKERTVGSHFGVFAKPLPGFINDIVAVPDDASASVTWSTTAPASSRVEFGPTEALGFTTPVQSIATTRHAVLVRGLEPGTAVFYRVVSVGASDGQTRASATRLLTTTNYASTTLLHPLDGPWKYTAANVSAQGWASPGYSDAGWEGPSNALLWVKTTAATPAVGVEPLGTHILSYNPATGFPYLTYYFRTRLAVPGVAPGSKLRVLARIDDGGVLYVNGTEALRIRMDPAPAAIFNTTLATGYPCGGDATCDEEFELDASLLKPGDNVVAVEVHNYNARSSDITFGMKLALMQPVNTPPELQMVPGDGVVRLEWSRGGFVLQESSDPLGPWLDVPGPQVLGPVMRPVEDGIRYFRLAR
ncbi:MAG: phosphodiester glycosidase family protein [Verrucomicrobiota bacterium]|jgi:hypothetical protein